MNKDYLTETEMFQALRDFVAQSGSLSKAGKLLFFEASYLCNTVNMRQSTFPESIAKAMGYKPLERYSKDDVVFSSDEVVQALESFIVDHGTQALAAKELKYDANYLSLLLAHRKKMTIPFARALGFEAERVFVKIQA